MRINEGSSNGSSKFQVKDYDGSLESQATASRKSSGTVLPYVGVACLGAILFGYHLGVVNGGLEYLAKDLGFADNTILQGWVVSTTLAGATVGSFTGGALADKLGRRRTFQLDAIPLVIGAFLSAIAQNMQAMIIGRLLAGIGIGISSALVPLYISDGYIWLEFSDVYTALGSEVTFVEALDQFMPGFDPEIGKLAQRVLINPRKNDYHTGVLAKKITPAKDGKPVTIELVDAKRKEPRDTLEVDATLIAIG